MKQEKHGLCHTAENGIWRGIRKRCTNPKDKKYRFYGARGISMCPRWDSFTAFIADVGFRPSTKHSLDRIDTFGNYEPGNCRWATQKEQCRNTRRNRLVTIGAETKCIAAWCEERGLKASVINTRILRGMSPIVALTTPVLGVGKKAA